MLAAVVLRFGAGGFTVASPPPFEAARAFELLEAQCALGPRVPGTPAHRAGRRFIEEELRRRTDRVEVRDVRGRSGWGEDLAGWNLVASFGRRGPPLLLGAHWDTRARADRDPDPARRLDPVLGANDGASGVAVLLELARILETKPPPRRVILAFFDLEDQGLADDPAGFCLGSKALAREIPYTPGAEAIVLDMIGRRGLQLLPEGYSMELARPLVEELWRLGAGGDVFRFRPGPYVVDDHLPFLRAGWRAVDLVDLDYPEWHTVADRPAACDPASLGAVGGVVRSYIYRLPPPGGSAPR